MLSIYVEFDAFVMLTAVSGNMSFTHTSVVSVYVWLNSICGQDAQLFIVAQPCSQLCLVICHSCIHEWSVSMCGLIASVARLLSSAVFLSGVVRCEDLRLGSTLSHWPDVFHFLRIRSLQIVAY